MQTIKRETHQQPIDNRLMELLQKPIQEIDLPFLRNAIEYLRLTVDHEISRAVFKLGSTAIDLAGTGGSGMSKFNNSTAAAFVVAAHGIDVVKFGNRSITGTSGSLDFLSALGCSREPKVTDMENVLNSTNLLFLSAPTCYPKLASIRGERKRIGKPTIFNFIGPLLNPVKPAYRLMGISNSYMHLLINQFIKTDGITKRAITVHSSIRSGYPIIEIDEFIPYTSNTATLIEQSIGGDYPATVKILDVPATLQVPSTPDLGATTSARILNGSESNVKIFLDIISGSDTKSIHFHGLVLNAGAAFLSTGAVSCLEDGVYTAKKLIANGSAARKLDQVRRVMS